MPTIKHDATVWGVTAYGYVEIACPRCHQMFEVRHSDEAMAGEVLSHCVCSTCPKCGGLDADTKTGKCTKCAEPLEPTVVAVTLVGFSKEERDKRRPRRGSGRPRRGSGGSRPPSSSGEVVELSAGDIATLQIKD